jgi:hypothetical protein
MGTAYEQRVNECTVWAVFKPKKVVWRRLGDDLAVVWRCCGGGQGGLLTDKTVKIRKLVAQNACLGCGGCDILPRGAVWTCLRPVLGAKLASSPIK